LTAPEAKPSITKTIETPKEELTTGSTFAGRYQIIEELGKGGMGRVYRALDKELNEEVALKLIKVEIAHDKNTVERFKTEIKLARKISHKSVGRVHELMEEKGLRFITMEYVPGEDLKSFLKRSGQLTISKAISIAKQICDGLTEAHGLGVVHRDLKPNNIMIDRAGNAKIMDFGIARAVKAKGITGPGVMIGTPQYMSPEQIDGKDVDHRSDIYSLGIILYEMLTDRVPFEGETPLTVGVKQKTETPKDPKDFNERIPDDLNRLVLKCLEKDQESRFQSSGEVRTELENIEKGIPITDKSQQKRGDTPRKISITSSLKRLFVPALFVFILIVGAGIIWQLLPKKDAVTISKKGALAVLPFENLGRPEDEYFADGITDEIRARLTNVSNLRVVARNSTIKYKDAKKSISEIGDELGVEYILFGTIRWQKSLQEGQVRVTPSLIRVEDSTQVWADVYDELITEVFRVQSDISKKVIEALGIVLLGSEQDELERMPTQNIEAYDYYLRGVEYQNRGADEYNIEMSIEKFEKAIELDQSFLEAYAQLSRALARYYWNHYDRTPEQSSRAREAAEKALKINPEAPETHIALGYYFYHCQLNYDKALYHFELALEKQPRNRDILAGIAYVKRRQGKMEEALNDLNKARELDPLSADLSMNLGVTNVLLRNFQEAERWYNHAIFLNPEFQRAHFHRVRLRLYQGDTKGARQILEQVSRSLVVLDPHRITYCWVLTDIFEGKFEDALTRLASVSIPAFSDQFYFVPVSLLNALIYGHMENAQLAKYHYGITLQFLEDKIKKDPWDSRYFSVLGITYAGLSKKEEAIQSAEKAVEILPTSKEIYRGAFRVYDLAQVFAMVGEYDRAIDQLEYLLSIPAEICEGLFRVDPIWNPLMEDSRFRKLIAPAQKYRPVQ
jgi:serine/threonine protein kinase/tetratricopeptide (TPR) repeat protein